MHYMGAKGLAADDVPGFEVARNISGNHDLKIRGRMPHNWIVNLSAGIAGAGVSVERGVARKVSAAIWEGKFELKPLAFGVDPAGIDYLRYVRTAAAKTDSRALSIDDFTLRLSTASQDAINLEVRADDQPGFLGAFLGRLSFFSLFPEEMVIETAGGKVFDRFRIKGVGGQVPSEVVLTALRRNMEGLRAA